MTTSTRSTTFLFAAGLAAASVLALPVFAQAATYAYVNRLGEVNAVTANDWMTAIATAPNIHPNSGVMLLTDQNSGILD